MKKETAKFFKKADMFLARAPKMVAISWLDEAGRMSYLAGFHAAQAFLFEKTGKITKTHDGLQSQFSFVAKDIPDIDLELKRFLGRAYSLKAVADYETGEHDLTQREVEATIKTAKRFVACLKSLAAKRKRSD